MSDAPSQVNASGDALAAAQQMHARLVKLQAWSKDIEQRTTALRDEANRLRAWEAHLAQRQQDYDRWKQELESRQAGLDQWQQQQEQRKTELTQWEHTLHDRQSQQDAHGAELDARQHALAAQQESLEADRKSVEQVRDQVATQQAQISILTRTAEDAARRADQRQKALDEAEARFESRQHDLEEAWASIDRHVQAQQAMADALAAERARLSKSGIAPLTQDMTMKRAA